MAWIPTLGHDEADGELAALYESMLDPVSKKVDHILEIHSLHPRGLRAHFELYRAVMASSPGLRKTDREMIAVVVSVINHCHY